MTYNVLQCFKKQLIVQTNKNIFSPWHEWVYTWDCQRGWMWLQTLPPHCTACHWDHTALHSPGTTHRVLLLCWPSNQHHQSLAHIHRFLRYGEIHQSQISTSIWVIFTVITWYNEDQHIVWCRLLICRLTIHTLSLHTAVLGAEFSKDGPVRSEHSCLIGPQTYVPS